MAVAGLDVGSLSTKCVIMQDGQIVSKSLVVADDETDVTARRALDEALRESGLAFEDLEYVVATGIGRKNLPFVQKDKSEFVALAKGIAWLLPDARTVIDMGAESSRVVKMNDMGGVDDFANNDKCASGTGVFLDAVAGMLEVSVEQLGELSLRASQRAPISAMCAVFAESEIVSHVHAKTPREEIIAGVHAAIADRTFAIVHRVTPEDQVVMTGGVALNPGMVSVLQEKIGTPIVVPEEPQMVAALGAALLARDALRKERRREHGRRRQDA